MKLELLERLRCSKTGNRLALESLVLIRYFQQTGFNDIPMRSVLNGVVGSAPLPAAQ